MVARDLTAFSWHTGGPVRALHEGERCPALYRDLGAVAMLRLLRGQLPRLAGPASPVTYMRTAGYVEPYTDHEHFGRVMLLPFGSWTPWHAGIADVYVTDADARGSEPIHRDGKLIGRCTSGGYGWRVGKSLALAMLNPDHAALGTELEVVILGTPHRATVIAESPYDPINARLRG